jgi:hypothetical protein
MVSMFEVMKMQLTERPRIPSIVWQIFWAWCYAPYLLCKVRKVNDVHGWRLQTIICCIAGSVYAARCA